MYFHRTERPVGFSISHHADLIHLLFVCLFVWKRVEMLKSWQGCDCFSFGRLYSQRPNLNTSEKKRFNPLYFE